MFIGRERSLTCTLAIACFLTVRLSTSYNCPTQSLEDVVIDIQSSLTKGIRGNEPIHTLTQEDCINSCCSTKNISGDKACNLMIFDTRKTTRQPNCYLFFCPSEEACPLKPAKGLRSYRIIRDFPSWVNPDLPSPVFAKGESLLHGPPAPAGTPGPGYPEPADILPRGTFPPKRGASGHVDRLLQIDPVSTRSPVSKGTGHSPSSPSSSEQTARLLPENGTALPPAAAAASLHTASAPAGPAVPFGAGAPGPAVPTATPRPPAGPAAPPAAAPSRPPAGAPTVSTPEASTTPTALAAAASRAPTGRQGPPERVPLSEVPDRTPTADETQTQNPATGLLPNVDSPALNKTASQPEEKPGSGGSSLRSVPGSQGDLPFQKWLLIGTLLFGVLFLTIGLVLLGRMFLESLRRKRYSRLDYLINGIYIDI